MHWVLNFKVHQTCTGTKKTKCWTSKCTKPAEGQKKQKFWTSKCTKPAQGQKKQKNKNFRGIVAPSQVDCEVFVFFVCFVPVQVWCTLKFKTFVFFLSLCRFCAVWSSKLVFFLSLCRFGGLWSPTPCLKPAQGQEISKFWTSKCTKPAQGQKKTKVLNFKVHQTCTGTKKQKNKNFRGIVAPSQVDCEVFVFFVFFVPVQVWWTLKFKTFVFFVPVQVWCTLNFKTCVFLSLCRFCAFYSLNLLFVLCLWRFGMTLGLLSKCIIPQGIGIVCLNVMFFHCFCWFPDSGSFSK